MKQIWLTRVGEIVHKMKPSNRIKKYVSGIMRNCIYKLTKNKLQKKKENNRLLTIKKICSFFPLESNDLYNKYCSK